jgi:UDP:flavonoid glycosyltransferase YjiC (YdhE family)
MIVLVLPYTHTLSHISRPLAVAMELRRRGHEIIFAGESPKISFIEHECFPVVPLYEPDPDLLYGNIREGKLRFVSDPVLERMIEADLALFRQIKPDIVLTDGRFSSRISTHIAGVKHAAIVNVSSTEYRALPYIPFFEWVPPWLVKRETGLWGMLECLNLKLEMTVFDNAMGIFKKISRKYRLRKTVTATNCLTGNDITLLADIPEYFPTTNLPADYHYIGPLTWKSAIASPSWWPPEKKNKPLVYITMGTTGVSDFFQKIHSLLKSSEFSAIITTGGQTADMETLEGKLYVEHFMDGDLVMEACDLVVCHGGNGTIYQALSHGKPVVGIPTIPDQAFNMRRVEALGIGKTLSWKDFSKTPELLLQLARSIINESSFYQNASNLKNIIATYDAPRKAANIISADQ